MVSMAVISETLKGIGFPVNKQKCVDYAMQRNASREVVETLERMPGSNFESMSSVWHAIGEEHKAGKMP